MPTDLILGTAGHIDHGKTTLIKALTGVDTDRLPEEKKRGITIELGFAELTLGGARLGIVDVPGHERFVRNMLAGATGIDLALLVVAADDSIKPQTREHFEILKLLDLSSGVIALTKCDLAEPDWIELVESEVRDLVRGTFLAGAAIVRTSAHTGQGLDTLRVALGDAAEHQVQSRQLSDSAGPFRMAIDRSFTVAGHGTVVTGSVQSGSATVGDSLALEPGGTAVRIRSLQSHDRPTEQVSRGQRAAVNLAGVHHNEIRRGQELASEGHLVPSRLLSVRLDLLAAAPRALKNRARVRLHIGTAELFASVVLLEHDELAPGESAMAQLYIGEPAVAVWGQPLILRSESPVATIGGGIVLDPTAEKIGRRDGARIARLPALTGNDPLERASAALYFSGLREWQAADLARSAGVHNVEEVAGELRDRGDLIRVDVSPTRTIQLHDAVLSELSDRVRRALEKFHAQYPLRRSVDRAPLASRFAYLGSNDLLDAVLCRMERAGQVTCTSQGVTLSGHGPQLSKNQQQLLNEIICTVRDGACQPPFIADLQKQADKNRAAVPELCALAVAEGELVRINDDFYLHHAVYESVREKLAENLPLGEGLTLSEIRELLGTSRKFAIPLCEHLDEIGFTRRHGDRRVLANTSPTA